MIKVAQLARGSEKEPPQWAGSFLPPAHSGSNGPARLTLLPGLGDDVSRTLAHHFGDVQGAVGLIGNGDGAVHSFSLDLWESRKHENPAHPQAHLRPHSPTDGDRWVPHESFPKGTQDTHLDPH